MSDLRIRPITEDEFADFRARGVSGYAESQVRAGNWRPQDAAALAERSFAELMPDGLQTPGMLVRVAELPDGTTVGVVWIALQGPGDDAAAAWIYEIEVVEAQRGRGYGRALLQAAEDEVAAHGITELGLNVFGSNAVARGLYESAGYATVSLHMRKSLGA